MLLQRTRERFSSAAEIADELTMTHEAAAQVLENLGSYNLLDVKVSDDLRYRYNPATPTLDSAATQSAESYQRQRIALIRLVTTGSGRATRTFAERPRRKGADPLI
jgi:hypothetical protein